MHGEAENIGDGHAADADGQGRVVEAGTVVAMAFSYVTLSRTGRPDRPEANVTRRWTGTPCSTMSFSRPLSSRYGTSSRTPS